MKDTSLTLMVGSGFRRAASSVVEHLTFNQGVPGSIPGRPTSKILIKIICFVLLPHKVFGSEVSTGSQQRSTQRRVTSRRATHLRNEMFGV
jgi:hypothetical protein